MLTEVQATLADVDIFAQTATDSVTKINGALDDIQKVLASLPSAINTAVVAALDEHDTREQLGELHTTNGLMRV